MKKRHRRSPSLIDRFCKKFGPAILKVCRLIDKQTHPFFEGLACVITFGEYRPRPYKEPEETKKDTAFSVSRRTHSIQDDIGAVMGDMHAVGRDISKAVKRLEHDNPEFAKAMQVAQNSPEFQRQAQIVRQRIAEVQERCNHIRRVCSHPTTVGSGNSYQNERQD